MGTVDIVREQIPVIVWAGMLLGTFVLIAVRNAFR